MADSLHIGEDLTRQFAQLGDIRTVTARLRTRLDDIAAANHHSAGTDDEYAQAYHKNVDEATQNLSDLVDGIGTLFDSTGTNGQAVAGNFGDVDEASTALVKKI